MSFGNVKAFGGESMGHERDDLIFVLSSEVGEIGGGAKSTRLLCEALRRIGKRVKLFVTLSPDLATRQTLEAQNIEVVLPCINKGWRWAIPQRVNAFQLFLQALFTRPTLIHSCGLSAEAKYLLHLPSTAPIYLWENTEALPHVKFVDKRIHKHLHKATTVLAPSNQIANNIRATYAYKGQIKLLPLWADQPNVKCTFASHTRTNELLYLGRFDSDKGIKHLFEAFRLIQPMCPDATLSIYGDGDIELVRRLGGDNPGVQICGPVIGERLEEVINHCDALVLPSLHEGYPLSLLEACARHKPVITTTVGSIPEVFARRACALLVPPGDTDALSKAMAKILSEDDAVYIDRCSDAIKLFEEINSTSSIHQLLLEVYELPAVRGHIQAAR